MGHVFVAGIFKVAWMVLDVPFNTETGARADLAMGDTSSGHTLVPKKSNSLPTGWLAYWMTCLLDSLPRLRWVTACDVSYVLKFLSCSNVASILSRVILS